jgi:hypothetical protein
MKRITVFLLAIICVGAADAATVRQLGLPRAAAARAATRSATTATVAPSRLSAVRAGAAPRLSVGRLHSNAGKSISSKPTPGGDVDLSAYALQRDLEALESEVLDKGDDLQSQIDALEQNGGQLPEIITGEYTGL